MSESTTPVRGRSPDLIETNNTTTDTTESTNNTAEHHSTSSPGQRHSTRDRRRRRRRSRKARGGGGAAGGGRGRGARKYPSHTMPAGAFAAVVSEGAGSGGDEDGAGGTRRGTRSVSTSSATRQRVSKRSGKSGQRNHKHKHKHKHKQQRRRRAHVRTHSAATETPHRAAHFLKKLADLLPQLALEHSEFPLEEYVPAFDWLLHVLTDPALHWGEQTPKAEVQTLDESEEVPSKRPALHVDVTPSSSVDSLVSSASPTTTPTSADKPSLSRPGSIDVLLTGPNDESTMLVKRRGPAEPPSPAPVAAPVQHSVTAETVLSLLDSLTEALVHVRDHTSTIRNICLQAQRTLAADPTALDAALRNTHIEPPPTHSFKRRAWSVSSPTGSGDEGTGGHASAGPPPTSSASTLSTDPAAAYATITAAPRGDALSFYERMEDMGFMVYPTTRDYIESKMPRANKIGSHRSLHLSQVQKDERQALEQAEEERLASIPQQVREKLGTIIYATPSCTDYLGYDPFDLQARPYLRLVAREDRPTLERCIRAALSAPHPPAGGHHPTLSLLQGSSRQGSNTLRLHGSSSTSSLSRLASPGNKTWPGKVTEAQTSAHVSLKRAREDGGGTVRVFMRVHARALGGDHTDDDDSEEDEDHAAPSSRPQPVLLLCTPVAPGKGSSLPGGAVSPLFPSTPRSRPTTPLHRLGGNLGPNDVPQVSLSNIYQDSSMRLKLLQRTPPPPTSSTRTVVHGKTAPIRAVSVPTSPASDSVLTGTDLKLAQPDGDGAAVDPNAPAAGPSSRATHLHSSLSLDSVESFSESVSSGDPGILPPALGVLSSINPDPVRTEAWGTREAQPSPTVSENESYTDSLLDLNDKPPTDTDEDEEDAERAKQQLPLISVDAPSADAVGPSLRTLSASPTPGTPQVSSSPGFQRAVSRLIHLLPEEEDRAVSPMSAGRKLLGQPQAAPTPSHVVELPRGGTLVRTSQGLLQFGMPPETIKDTMSLGFDVPTHFVMPKILFDREAGINVAEFEFPAYWNFFILKKQVSLVTTPDVAERVRRVFTHTLIGPKVENDDEFLGEEAQRCKPDLNKECGWFNTHPYKPGERLQNDSMVHFIFYDDQRVAQVWDGVTVCDQGHEFVLYDQGKEIFRTSVMVQLPRIFEPRSPRRQSTSADPSPRASPMSTSADEAAGTSGSYVDGDFALRDSATGGDDAGAGRLLDVPSRMRGSSGGGSNTGSAFPVSPTLSGVSTGSNTSWDDGGEPEAEDADQDEEARQLRRHSTEFAQEHNLHVDVGIGGDPEMALCSPLPSPTSGGQGSGGDSMQRLYSFNPPQFGVTFLGTSHGFDPTGTTTGFVLWVNGKGFMVDPPPRSGQLLKLYGIAPILIDGVIVTHCHADHDAGTFHKILEDRRVTVLTTPTIMRSFLAKYSAISGIEEALLRRLFVFRPVRIGEPMNIHGSHLHFFYSLHAIPCIGFECYYGGKSMVYSADTMNNDTYINQMFEEGIMTEARRDALLSFPWHHTLVLHEAGVPPIHTPLSTFEKLTEEEKERLYLVHVTASKVPPESGLKVAKEGVANTIVIPIEEAPIFSNATNVLQLLSTLEFFNNLSLTQTTELLQICEFEEYEAGTVITNAGDGGESYTFYVIVSGVVRSVKRNGNTYYLSSGDYFGYKSLTSSGQVRSSSTHMAAETTLCLRFQRHPLRRLLAGSQSLRKMRRMEKLRRPVSRRTGHVDEAGLEVIRLNTVLGTMEHSQRAVLRQYLHRQTVEAGDVIIPFGQAPAKAVLVGRDTVLRVEVDDDAFAQRSDQVRRPPRLLGIGAFVADVHAMLHNADLRRPADDSLREDDDEAAQHDSGKTIIPSFVKVTVRKPGVLFTIAASHLMHFFEAHPGVLISFLNTTYRV